MKRTILAAGAATVLAGATLLGTTLATTTGATAATSSTTPPLNAYVSYPTGVHNAPSLQAPASKTLSAGTRVAALCMVPNGSEVDGNTTWFRIATDEAGGGWVPRSVLGGVPDLPNCAA